MAGKRKIPEGIVVAEGEKYCSRCTQVKPVGEFNKRSQSKDGLAYACRECERSGVKDSYDRNRGARVHRQYYKEHREEILDRNRDYYEQHKEERQQYHREYQKNHPEVRKKADARRRQLLKENKGEPYTRYDIIDRDSVDGVLYCGICNQPVDINEFEIDHIKPISEGGKDELDNVRAAHSKCNTGRPRDGRDLAPKKKSRKRKGASNV